LLDRSPELRHTGVVKIRSSLADARAGVAGAAVAPAAAPAPVPAAIPDGQTRRAIVRLLLESGSITVGEIGDRLGLAAAGVRRHLDALIDAGDAESVAAAAWQQVGRGRPAKRFRLTAAGRAKLGHAYDDLASAAMRQLREIGGEAAVQAFARRRVDAILAGVQAADSCADADVEAAAERVAGALTKAGYVATTTRVGGPIHGVQICQHHCPVSHVAEEFPELCEAEQQAMAEVLGTHVQRLATIVNGDCACTTHVPLTQIVSTIPSKTRPIPAPSPRHSTTSTEGASL
jgi:predicted ArsR family transcriptional regulator